jgi:hypothetical protein
LLKDSYTQTPCHIGTNTDISQYSQVFDLMNTDIWKEFYDTSSIKNSSLTNTPRTFFIKKDINTDSFEIVGENKNIINKNFHGIKDRNNVNYKID